MELVLAGLVPLGILLAFTGLARMVNAPTRVSTVAGQYTSPRSLEEMQMAQPFEKRVLWPIFRSVAGVIARYTPQHIVAATRRKLDLAGNPFDLPVLEFLGLRGVAALIGTSLIALLLSLLNANPVQIAFLGLSSAFVGFYAPVLWLDMKIRKRQEEILLELPDVLDLLTVCVEAGLGLDAAVLQVVQKWDNELTRALKRMHQEMRLGRPREQALRDLADRAGVRELTNFVGAIIQAERFGSGVARVLRIQSEQQRIGRRQRAQYRANQLPVKLLFPLTLFIFPATLIVLLGPAMIRILQTFEPK